MGCEPLEEVGCIAAVEGDEAAGVEPCLLERAGRKRIGAIGRYMAVTGVGGGLEVMRELLEGVVGF